MENFTPWSALLGGSLLGAAALLLMYFNGRIAGISGIVSGVISPEKGDTSWRLWFIGGLLLGPLLPQLAGVTEPLRVDISWGTVALAGLLVGIGTRLGSGCTSGHGICGIGRGSKRSIAATGMFMATAAGTVFILRHLLA